MGKTKVDIGLKSNIISSGVENLDPHPFKIRQLIDMFLDRELLLPEMQRRYVWTSTKVRDLMDSVYHEYP